MDRAPGLGDSLCSCLDLLPHPGSLGDSMDLAGGTWTLASVSWGLLLQGGAWARMRP